VGDLSGVLVVAIEQAVAAPYASGRLADAGARVIKVERPEGDFARGYDRLVEGQSAYFVWLNRGKESVCLDLKAPADLAVLHAMIAKADVVLQNLRPGLAAEMGFGAQALRAANPRLITCDITGFGLEGPRSKLKAYDLIVQGESGLCAITGDGGPARIGVSVCDIAAGMTAHAGILQALYARERTGQGRAIQVSLFDAVADWMNVPLLQYLYGGKVAARAGVNHPTIAPYGAYGCADGVQVIFSVQNDREWVAFCQSFLERPDLTRDPRFADNTDRVANRTELDAVVGARFASLTEAQAAERLEAAGIAYGRLNTVEQAAVHPHLRFVTLETPAGEIRVVAPAAVIDDLAPVLRPLPALGQHTDALKAEFA
jgi:crotonobetainyl-CoA:carnitine CoA-transferase CaiB-like acyl-CoA transferase